MKVGTGRSVLVGLMVGFVLIGMILPPSTTSDESEAEVMSLDEPSFIWFYHSGLEIDTSDPSAMMEMYGEAETGDYYVIQYSGYLTADRLQRLQGLGVRLYEYLPYNGYVVGIDKSVVSEVKDLDFIRFIMPYYSSLKISEDLLDRPLAKVKVFLYPDADFERNLRKIESIAAVYGTSSRHRTLNVMVADFRMDELIGLPDVRHLAEDIPIVIYNNRAATLEGNYEAQLSSTSGLYNLGSGLPLDLTGAGEVIGFVDTGFDIGSAVTGHPDFFKGPGPGCNRDRVLAVRAWTGHLDDPDGHGTHVAGDALGNGYVKEYVDLATPCDNDYTQGYAGVAPEAEVTFDSCGQGGGLSVTIPDMWELQYADGARLHSNSWGPSIIQNTYGGAAGVVDAFQWDNPDTLVVFAAGNEGPPWNTVSGGGNSHNGLSVGAGENDRPTEGAGSDDPTQLSSYSSRGPVEQRLKPDIVGTSELAGPKSARAQADEYADIVDYQYYNPTTADYWYMGGTSAATPRVAGHGALVRQFYKDYYGLTSAQITSPLVKATLINGAYDMGYGYPSYDQGWGKVSIKNSLFPTAPRTNQWATGTLSAGETWDASVQGGMNLNIRSTGTPLKITLVHTAPMGAFLQDDLDLEAISPSGTVYKGNFFATENNLPAYDDWSYPDPGVFDWDSDYYFTFDGDNDDDYNTVENIFVEEPELGIWTVRVQGDTNAVHNPPFALIFAADVGPFRDYQVALTTVNPTRYTVHQGGSATFAFNVLNFGTNQDTIELGENPSPPALMTVQYKDSSGATVTGLNLEANEDRDLTAIMGAIPGLAVGAYSFCIVGTSQNDFTDPIASDRLCLLIDVVQQRFPRLIEVTNETYSQTEPYVIAFNDGVTDHVFIAYKAEATEGTRVEVKHSTDGGLTFGPPQRISWIPDGPTDIRMTYFNGSSTNWSYRVFITWHGNDPTIEEVGDWVYVAYADAPYNSWTLRHVDTNSGPSWHNVKRMTFLLPLPTPPTGPTDQLLLINEVLEYAFSGQPNPSQVSVLAFFSYDGGETWTNRTPDAVISPRDGNYHFFPNGLVDEEGYAWILYYWRLAGAAQTDRDLCFQYFDGTNFYPSVGVKQDIMNTFDSLMFPAGVSTTEGAGGNRIYDVFTRSVDSNADKQMFVVYTDDMGATWEPWDHIGGWTPDDTNPTTAFGGIVSQTYYVTRPVLDIDDAENALLITYYEEDTIPTLGAPNINVICSQDGFTTGTTMELTADAYAKGQPISDTISTTIFTTYHTRGQKGDTDIVLRIYSCNWQSDPDDLGPVTTAVASSPNPINLTAYSQFLLSANIDDTTTGYSDITAAEYFLQKAMPQPAEYGTGTSMSPADGTFDNPIEAVISSVNIPGTWILGQCRRVWVHGQDSLGYWGDPEFVEICLTAVGAAKPAMPIMTDAVLSPTIADVTLNWDASPDDGGGEMDILSYSIHRANSYTGPYQNVDNVTATQSPSYTWTDIGTGHGDPLNYFYCVRAFDGVLESECPDIGAKFTMPLTVGVHLMSIPVQASDASVPSIFQTISVSRVWTYDAFDTADHWKTWNAAKQYTDLPAIDITMGLWVEVAVDGDLTVAGLIPRTVSVPMVKGWTLIGVPTFYGFVVSDTGVSAVEAEGYDAMAPPHFLKKINLSDPMVTGWAYWVRKTTQAPWTIYNSLP